MDSTFSQIIFSEAAYLDSIGWQNEGIAFEFNFPSHWDGPVRPA
ncbi:hypothetical protein [Lactococcus cremoris]|nr:hypothetical protein [Lactococcus cremoris]